MPWLQNGETWFSFSEALLRVREPRQRLPGRGLLHQDENGRGRGLQEQEHGPVQDNAPVGQGGHQRWSVGSLKHAKHDGVDGAARKRT